MMTTQQLEEATKEECFSEANRLLDMAIRQEDTGKSEKLWSKVLIRACAAELAAISKTT